MRGWLMHLLEAPGGKRDNKASPEHLEKPQTLIGDTTPLFTM
ncbi:hypothetical protein [Vibrio sp. RE86]|nr:hypothetical protein [Vibrio sp. RE86]